MLKPPKEELEVSGVVKDHPDDLQRLGPRDIPVPSDLISVNQSASILFNLAATKQTMFRRGDNVVYMTEEGKLKTVTASNLPSIAECYGTVMEIKSLQQGIICRGKALSKDVASTLLNAEAAIHELPELKILAEFPFLIRVNQKLIRLGKGYHPEFGVLVEQDMDLPKMTVPEAKEILLDLLYDWKFDTVQDRNRAVAMLLNPAMKRGRMIKAKKMPVDVVQADKSHAGKDTLANVQISLYTAHMPKIVTQRKGGVGSPDESFGVAVAEAREFVRWANVRGVIDSPMMESAVSEGKVAVRLMRKDEVEVETWSLSFTMTTNGAEQTEDMSNRCNFVNITKQEGDYQFREYAEGTIEAHGAANRARYLGAVYTILQRWADDGFRTEHVNTADHDFTEWAGAVEYICQRVLDLGSAMEGHRDSKRRASHKAEGFAREFALAIQTEGKNGHWLLASAAADMMAQGSGKKIAPTVFGKNMRALFGSVAAVEDVEDEPVQDTVAATAELYIHRIQSWGEHPKKGAVVERQYMVSCSPQWGKLDSSPKVTPIRRA